MSEIFDRSNIGIKATLIGCSFASVGVKDGIYYIDARAYDGENPVPRRVTLRADWRKLRDILNCLPAVHKTLIKKTVIENGDFLVIGPDQYLEIPPVAGTVEWSDLLERPCVDVERVIKGFPSMMSAGRR